VQAFVLYSQKPGELLLFYVNVDIDSVAVLVASLACLVVFVL
jgi:hypothetical protein